MPPDANRPKIRWLFKNTELGNWHYHNLDLAATELPDKMQ
jgi:hypothetical protein